MGRVKVDRSSKKVTLSKIKHPDSRKTSQLIRLKQRENKRLISKETTRLRFSYVVDRALWFRDHMNPDLETYSPSLLADLIDSYLNRFKPELEYLNSKKPYEMLKYSSRKSLILNILEEECRDYNTCGLEIPDLLNTKNMEELRQWNGEQNLLQNVKLARFSKKKLQSFLSNEIIQS